MIQEIQYFPETSKNENKQDKNVKNFHIKINVLP